MRSQACTFTTTLPKRMDSSGLILMSLLLPVRLLSKPMTATRSAIGVAPKSFAAIFLLLLPLGTSSGLTSVILGLGSSSEFGSISHAEMNNDAKVIESNDAILWPLLVVILFLGTPSLIGCPVTMLHNHPLRWRVFHPLLMHQQDDGHGQFLLNCPLPFFPNHA